MFHSRNIKDIDLSPVSFSCSSSSSTMKKPFPAHSTRKFQHKHHRPRSKKREPVASGAKNLLDQRFFSGMKKERGVNYESEESSEVSVELSLSISNHDPENHKRKLESHRLALSCSPTSKKSRISERKNGEIISSMADNCTELLVSSATRNLLEKPFFLGSKIGGLGGYGKKESTRVSTELSLSISNQSPENLERDEKETIVPRLVDEAAGINDVRVSTELKLFDESWVTSNSTSLVPVVSDPWTVKKNLTATDSCISEARLLIPSGSVKEHILPLIGAPEAQIDEGIDVRVWDCDTSTLHWLKFRRWISFNGYVLIGKWAQEFVVRRELKENDTIGLYWNVSESRFHFSVLERAAVVNLLPCV